MNIKYIQIPLIALAAAVLAIGTLAQSPSKVLKQAEKALGGAKALLAIQSYQKTGVITRTGDGVTGRYVAQASRPNLSNVSIELDGFEIETGYNGRSAWSRNSRDGMQTLTGDAANAVQTQAGFGLNLWLNAKADKSKIVSGGQANVGETRTNLVVLTTAKGTAIKLYFDAVSGLLLRDEMPAIDGMQVTDYSDYRTVGSVKQPFAYRISAGGQTYSVKIDDIKFDRQIARSEFDFPNIAGRPLPELRALLTDLQVNEDKLDAILDTYAFTQKQTRRELGKDGILRDLSSETYQLSFYMGYRIRRLVEKNGKPLSGKDQADADKDAAKQVAEIEKKQVRFQKRLDRGETDDSSEQDHRISIAELLRASNLINPRRERFRGRDVIVFDFEPNPAFDFSNVQSMVKFFGKTAGVMWVDEQDKQVARIEAVLYDNFNIGGGVLAKLRKGASFTLDQERINNEIWLPSQTNINLSVRVFLIKGIDLNQSIRSYDYRKFDTEVKDATINEIKKP